MANLEQVITILIRILAAGPNSHPGCDHCHGEPFVHSWDDQAGRSYADRCTCPLGRWFASHDKPKRRRA